jgi:adenosylcobinamide-GDP ribazoletransferase
LPIATERRLRELAGACALLTRVPVTRWATAPPSRCVWAYPLVGAGVGLLGALVAALPLPRVLAGFWGLATMLVVSGALHEDGLADAADGVLGGATRERRLAIMRDSRIGSFGAIALILGIGIRAAAIAALPRGALFGAMIAAAALSRAAMLIAPMLLIPARTDGLGAGLAAMPRDAASVGLALGAVVALLALPARLAIGAAALALGIALALAALARRSIGGYTGDVLGATSVIAECAALSLVSSGFA